MTMKWLSVVALTWGTLACGGTSAAPASAPAQAAPTNAEPSVMRMAGSRVSLWVPPEMRRPTRLAFVKMDEPLALIAIAEMTSPDGSPTDMLAGAKQGAELVDEQPAERGKAKGFIGNGKSETGLERRVLALGDGAAIAVIVAQYQKEAAPIVERILDSVQLDGAAALDPLALSGISISDRAGFAVWNTASQPIMLVDEGARPPLSESTASFALMSMPYPKPEISNEELGQMLGSVIGKKNPNMEKAKMDAFPIAGSEAFVVAVPGEKDGKPVGIYAFITRRPDSAFLGFGDVGLAQFETALPRFERLAKSIQLDDSIFSP
jgi:hypothetical protein